VPESIPEYVQVCHSCGKRFKDTKEYAKHIKKCTSDPSERECKLNFDRWVQGGLPGSGKRR
jgi:hypothetical protein